MTEDKSRLREWTIQIDGAEHTVRLLDDGVEPKTTNEKNEPAFVMEDVATGKKIIVPAMAFPPDSRPS